MHDEKLSKPIPGVWMTRTIPLTYRVLPKCACSTIGQSMHFIDYGEFYPGSIHNANSGFAKSENPEDFAEIVQSLQSSSVLKFTLVRNPFERVLSAFADKIIGFQTNGRHYRDGFIHNHLESYGASFGGDADLVKNFHRFVELVCDSVELGSPMAPDVHWRPCMNHLRSTHSTPIDFEPDFVGHIENLDQDILSIFERAKVPRNRLPPKIPHANKSRLPKIPLESFYGEQQIGRVARAYAEDFEVFKYSDNSLVSKPHSKIDLDRVLIAQRQA